jgi:hypothetical protein
MSSEEYTHFKRKISDLVENTPVPGVKTDGCSSIIYKIDNNNIDDVINDLFSLKLMAELDYKNRKIDEESIITKIKDLPSEDDKYTKHELTLVIKKSKEHWYYVNYGNTIPRKRIDKEGSNC